MFSREQKSRHNQTERDVLEQVELRLIKTAAFVLISTIRGPDAPPGDLYRASLEQYQHRQDRADSLEELTARDYTKSPI